MKIGRIIINTRNFLQGFLLTKDFYVRLLLIPIIIAVVCIIYGITSLRLQSQIQHLVLKPFPVAYTLYSYPTLGTYVQPLLSAQAAAIFDPQSGVFLYTKNSSLRFSIASTTKIMSALVAIKQFKHDDILTVQRDYIEGSSLQLFKGEQFSFENLLYAMLLNSANDAAYAIADNYPGGIKSFVSRMNATAAKFHLWNTSFIDPAGLEDDNDFSTVTDLARLAGIALQQPTIAQVIATKSKTINTVDNNISYPLENLNKLLGYDGVIGMKTGTTEGAGQVLITAKEYNGHTFIIVVIQSTDRYADTWSLLNLIDTNTQFIDPLAMEK